MAIDRDTDPPYARRFYRRMTPWLFALYLGSMVFIATGGSLDWLLPPLGPGATGLLPHLILRGAVPVLVILAVLMIVAVRWERRLMRRLRASGYALCPGCGYSLGGHAGEVECPECGERCDVEDARRAWRDFRPRYSGLIVR